MVKTLNLPEFFPYKLTQLQAKISNTIADIYTGKFDLSRQEWRILAALGGGSELSAKQIGLQTNLEKMPASRAISKMLSQSLIVKAIDKNDKRSSLLKLTAKGHEMYQQIVPMAVQREQELLSIFSKEEVYQLNQLMDKLVIHSEKILLNKNEQ